MAVAEITESTVKPMRELPGPKPLPIVGRVWNSMKYATDPVGTMDSIFAKYGRIAGLVHGSEIGNEMLSRIVVAYGADLNRIGFNHPATYYKASLNGSIMSRNSYKHERQAALNRWGTGLFALNEEPHKATRRLMMPAFHKKRIETYFNQMVDLTNNLLSQWQTGTTRDISEDMMMLTMYIASETLFGTDVTKHGHRIGELLQETLEMVVSPGPIVFPYDVPGTPYHHLLNITNEFEGYLREVIASKQTADYDDGTVLSMLLQSRYEDSNDGLSEDELIGHAGVIFAAGHETSSNVLTWTLMLLSQFPDIARKLVSEVDSVLKGQAPTVETIYQMPYLEWVIKESMRVIPTVVINERVLAEDAEIGGYHLEEGIHLHLSIYHVHKDESIYENPYEFKPDRWETISPSPYEYCPFSTGHRMCIGATFAMMEIKIVLAMILQRFRVQGIPGTQIDRKGIITIAPKNGLPLVVQPRDGMYSEGVGGLTGQVRDMVNLPL